MVLSLSLPKSKLGTLLFDLDETIPDEVKHPYVNSVTAGRTDFWEVTEEVIVNFLLKCAKGLVTVIAPFVENGCKIGIVSGVTVYYCTKDKRVLTYTMKCGIIYLIFKVIKGSLGIEL